MASPKSILTGSLVGTTTVDPFSLNCGVPPTKWSTIRASKKSQRTINPIRSIVDPIIANVQTGEERGDGKDFLSLALGDPTNGDLRPCPVAIRVVSEALNSSTNAAGYIPATGLEAARKAVAKHHKVSSHDHVVVANGVSGALELVLTALLDEGSILLVPQPGFSLYQVIAESHGARVVHYRLLEEKNWECDFCSLRSLIHEYSSHHIAGILVNNPSNPTGAVFSECHLRDIVNFCAEHHLPIVADEVYGDITYGEENKFLPIAQVAADSKSEVPVVTVSGLGKQFLVPGWRVGWAVFHDNIHGSLVEVEKGTKRLAQVILGASHLVQNAIPALLDPHSEEVQIWKGMIRKTLQDRMNFVCNLVSSAPGLKVSRPGGAMYALVRIDVGALNVKCDKEFATLLLKEQNVFVLPGSCFGIANVFRLVFCSSPAVLEEAASRILEFCTNRSHRGDREGTRLQAK